MHYLDRLTALSSVPRDRSRHSADRPVQVRVDSDGSALAVELPGPRTLATLLVLPYLRDHHGDTFRAGASLLGRPRGAEGEPTPINAFELAEALMTLIDTRTGTGGLWTDLRLYVAHGERAIDYLRSAVAQARLLSPTWRPSAVPNRVRTRRSVAEQKAIERARNREREIASARWWLELLLDGPDERREGDTLTAAELYRAASEALTEFAEDEVLLDDDDPASVPRVPGPRTFYDVADAILGPRYRGTGNVLRYRIPSPSNAHRTRELLARGRYARALTLQRARLGV